MSTSIEHRIEARIDFFHVFLRHVVHDPIDADSRFLDNFLQNEHLFSEIRDCVTLVAQVEGLELEGRGRSQVVAPSHEVLRNVSLVMDRPLEGVR